jgi:hypothetical protein
MDREKVIKAIDICLGHGKCDDCGYRIKDGYSTMDCRKPMMRDALALLKEQNHERLKVNIRHRNNDGYCPSCGKCIVMDFCPNNCGFCGQAVKWIE